MAKKKSDYNNITPPEEEKITPAVPEDAETENTESEDEDDQTAVMNPHGGRLGMLLKELLPCLLCWPRRVASHPR